MLYFLPIFNIFLAFYAYSPSIFIRLYFGICLYSLDFEKILKALKIGIYYQLFGKINILQKRFCLFERTDLVAEVRVRVNDNITAVFCTGRQYNIVQTLYRSPTSETADVELHRNVLFFARFCHRIIIIRIIRRFGMSEDAHLRVIHNLYICVCVLLSRTRQAGQAQTAAAAAHLTRALEGCKCSRRFAPEEILTKDWAQLTGADLAALASCGYRQASCEKLHFDEHEAFSSLCFLEQHLTLQQLQAAADHLFADAACGHVLRVKGFAPDPQGTTGWLELNATAAGRTLEPIPQGQDVLIVIGEGLDRARIETQLHR